MCNVLAYLSWLKYLVKNEAPLTDWGALPQRCKAHLYCVWQRSHLHSLCPY